MRIYLDDDCAGRHLIEVLKRAGHDVQTPADVSRVGVDDSVHLLHAIRDDRIVITANYDDFENLHNLVVQSGGSHPGIFAIRKDRDRSRNMKPAQITRAIGNVAAAGVLFVSEFIVLNHWR